MSEHRFGVRELRMEHDIQLRRFSIEALEPTVTFWDTGPGVCRMSVSVDMVTTDRDDPRKVLRINFADSINIDVGQAKDRDFVASFVRSMLNTVVQHEVSERLYVGGVRVFDPHEERKERR